MNQNFILCAKLYKNLERKIFKNNLQKYWSQYLYYRLRSYVLFQTADLYIQELGVGEGGGRGCTHLADPQKL